MCAGGHRAEAQRPAALAQAAGAVPEAQQIGARLLKRCQLGIVRLTNPDRDTPQLRQIAATGGCRDMSGRIIPVSPDLLRMLDRLSARSTRAKPMELMSLYREPKSRPTREPHANGMGADIAAFGGCRIDPRNPERCVRAVVALVDALGKGEYRVGLPKPPNTDPVSFLPPPPLRRSWPFFPAPVPVAARLIGHVFVLPRPDLGSTRTGGLKPLVARWENERGAPLGDVGDRRVRLAIASALQRGANLYALFPDALDHLHIDMRPLTGTPSQPAKILTTKAKATRAKATKAKATKAKATKARATKMKSTKPKGRSRR